MVQTGLRISETLALDWSDIDLENGCVNVRRTISTEKIEGLPKQPKFEFFNPKTNAGFRETPIIDSGLQRTLSELKSKRSSELLFHQEDGSPYTNRWSTNDEPL